MGSVAVRYRAGKAGNSLDRRRQKRLKEAARHYEAGRLAEAEAACAHILAKLPRDGGALKVLALVAIKRGDHHRAVELLARAQECNPKDADLWMLSGMCLARLGDIDGTIVAYQRSLELKPGKTAVLNNLANALSARGDVGRAVAALMQAIDIDPKDPVLYHTLGNALFKIDRLDGAIARYEQALSLDPDFVEAVSSLLHTAYHACRWERLEELNAWTDRLIRENCARDDGAVVEMPLANVTRCDDLAINHLVATAECRRVEQRAALHDLRFDHGARRARARPRITVGYLSNAFRTHPTSALMWSLFEHHDRARFEVHAYSTGTDDRSEARRRIEETCDRFIDVQTLDTGKAAQAIYDNEVDVLVDLDGHIQGERLEIVALRPAPVTAAYLGFPGTSGARFIDYILTDRIVSPPEHAPWYTEAFAYLPHSYQCNDNVRTPSSRLFSRGELGLPENAFVLCSFNQAYKIEPVMFDVWMRLLKALPDSVLWLWRNSPGVDRNLRREAENRGVPADRLVFAEKMPWEDHIARLRLADLALDTRLCNGHTTTSDTLRAGVPVVTLLGRHFASRVSASLLTAVGLPELITHSLEAYEALVLRLARNRDELGAVRDRLGRNRAAEALFDTGRFVGNLERAFEEMVRIWRAGEAPRPFEVSEP